MLLILVAGCFLVAPVAASSAPPLATPAASLPFTSNDDARRCRERAACCIAHFRRLVLANLPGGRVHELDAHRAASHHRRETPGRGAVRRDQPCVPPHSAAPSSRRGGKSPRWIAAELNRLGVLSPG